MLRRDAGVRRRTHPRRKRAGASPFVEFTFFLLHSRLHRLSFRLAGTHGILEYILLFFLLFEI